MKNFNAFITKFLLYVPVTGLILPIFGGVSMSVAVLAATVATLAAFLTSDLVVYPRYGNLPALLVDLLITAVVLLEFSGFRISLQPLAAVLVLIGAGELYYHRYIGKILFPGRRR